MKQHGLYDEAERLEKLGKIGDSLEKFTKYIQRENFRETLTNALKKRHPDKAGVRRMIMS